MMEVSEKGSFEGGVVGIGDGVVWGMFKLCGKCLYDLGDVDRGSINRKYQHLQATASNIEVHSKITAQIIGLIMNHYNEKFASMKPSEQYQFIQ